MIIVQVDNIKEVSLMDQQSISDAYGKRFDPNHNGYHALVIACDRNGRWNNRRAGAVPGWFAFNLADTYDPSNRAFADFMADVLPDWAYTVKRITNGRIKKPSWM